MIDSKRHVADNDFQVGLFLLGPGLYAAVKQVTLDYAAGVSPAFSCLDVSI